MRCCWLLLKICRRMVTAPLGGGKTTVFTTLPQNVLAAIAAVTILGVPFHGSADGRKKLLTCDDTLKNDFQPEPLTTVLLVKAFNKGQALTLSTPTPTTPVAANDVCVVKLLVGPGNPGAAGAPSTSPGIGIEVWLPSRANWNRRIHVAGGGGWAGGSQTSLTVLACACGAGGTTPSPSFIAAVGGAVSANTGTARSGTGGGSVEVNSHARRAA